MRDLSAPFACLGVPPAPPCCGVCLAAPFLLTAFSPSHPNLEWLGGFVRVGFLFSQGKKIFSLEKNTGDSHLRSPSLCPASSWPNLASFRSSAAPLSGWRLRARFAPPTPWDRRSRPRPSLAVKGRAEEEPVAQRQEMVIGTLALLWYFVILAMM